MDRPDSHPHAIKIFLTLNAAALAAAGILMLLLSPRGGPSTLRLVLIAAAFLLAAGAAAAAILLQIRQPANQALQTAVFHSAVTGRLPLILGAVFLVLWCLTWFPPQYTGVAYYYFIGLYPLILWGTLATGSATILIVLGRSNSSDEYIRRYLREHRLTLLVALIALTAFGLIALLTSILHILSGYEPFWYGAGVPLLAPQVLLAVIIAIFALLVSAKSSPRKLPVDLLLFFLIWGIAGLLWASQPVPASFWVTAPRLPNLEYYPFSDLTTFDLGSQFALIGQGIFNRLFFDRGLYMSFLVYLHTLGGQDYQRLMSIQAVLFAVFPALLYLLGRRLHSRTAGLILASLTTLRGLNSLTASAWIDTSTFKHMLTDFPTAIGLALFMLFVLRWLDSPEAHESQGIWAAGILGLTSLLRPHVVLLLLALGLLAIGIYRARSWRGPMVAGMMLIGFLAGVAPWLLFGPSSGSIFLLYGRRIRDVIGQRYPQALRPALGTPTRHPDPKPQLPAGGTNLPDIAPGLPGAGSGFSFALPQYFHNLVTSALIFPDSPEFLSVKDTVKAGEEFWRPRWDGGMSPIAAGMLILNLAVVAVGLGAAYQRGGWRSLLPLAALLIYHIVSALARTSGGRYLVPTDWILVFYFAVGLGELVLVAFGLALRQRRVTPDALPVRDASRNETPWPRRLAALAQLALIGGLVPLAGVLYPTRYPPRDPVSLAQQIEPYTSNLGWSSSDVDAFLHQPGAVLLYGRALYPRFYPQDDGEPTAYLPFTARNFPRTVFVLIGPSGTVHAMLAGPAPRVLPNASDAIVLGCSYRQAGYDMVSALAVVLPQQGVSIARLPAAPLSCPLPDPICDNNKICY